MEYGTRLFNRKLNTSWYTEEAADTPYEEMYILHTIQPVKLTY
jgi:hypothetical protein